MPEVNDHPRVHRRQGADRPDLLRRGRPPRGDAVPAQRARRRDARREAAALPRVQPAAARPPRAGAHAGREVQLRPARAHLGDVQRRGDGQPGQGGRSCSAPTARRWKATTPRRRGCASRKKLNVKVIVDDNNVTISGHPQQYMPGFDVAKTLAGPRAERRGGRRRGHRQALRRAGDRVHARRARTRVVVKRKMAPGHRRARRPARTATTRSRPNLADPVPREARAHEGGRVPQEREGREEPARPTRARPAPARTATTSARSSTRSSTR